MLTKATDNEKKTLAELSLLSDSLREIASALSALSRLGRSPQLRNQRIDLLELQAARPWRAGRTPGRPPAVIGFHHFHDLVPAALLDHASDSITHRLEVGP